MKPAGCAGWLKTHLKAFMSQPHGHLMMHEFGLLQPHEASPEKASSCFLLTAWSSLQFTSRLYKTKEAPR